MFLLFHVCSLSLDYFYSMSIIESFEQSVQFVSVAAP